jgi:Protein of unknown function (DUF3185)
MNRAVGFAVMIGGIVLLLFGLQASNSFTSNLSKTFTGSPTNQSIWMIVLAVILIVAGLVLSFGGGRNTRV